MVKKFEYSCDGGCIMLGNKTSRVCLPNGYGDGCFTVEVRDLASGDFTMTTGYDWLGTVEGDNIHIYDYDCLRGENLNDDSPNVLCTLPSGRWAIFVNNGKVIIQQWD